MAVRRYRVTERLPYMVDDRAVVLQPGDMVKLDDKEAGSLYRKVKGLDAAGRAVLDLARIAAEAPAAVSWIQDLSQEERIKFCKASFEPVALPLRFGSEPARGELLRLLRDNLPKKAVSRIIRMISGRRARGRPRTKVRLVRQRVTTATAALLRETFPAEVADYVVALMQRNVGRRPARPSIWDRSAMPLVEAIIVARIEERIAWFQQRRPSTLTAYQAAINEAADRLKKAAGTMGRRWPSSRSYVEGKLIELRKRANPGTPV